MNDLVINEALVTGPVQLNLRGDRDVAIACIPLAKRLLGSLRVITGVNERIAQGDAGGYFQRTAVLPDGTLMIATTNNGMDDVQIIAAGRSRPSEISTDTRGVRMVRVPSESVIEVNTAETWRQYDDGAQHYKHSGVWDDVSERMLVFGGWPGIGPASVDLRYVERVPTYQEYSTTGGTGGPTAYTGPIGSNFGATVTITWPSGLLYETKNDGVTASGGFGSALYDAIVGAASISDSLGTSPSVTLEKMAPGSYFQFVRGSGYFTLSSSGWAIKIESSNYPADGYPQFMYVFINTNFAGAMTTFAEEFWHEGITNSLTNQGYGPGEARYVRIGVDSSTGLAYAQYYGAGPGYAFLGNEIFDFDSSEFADDDTVIYDPVTPTISTVGNDDATYQSFTPLTIYDLAGGVAKPSNELWEFTYERGWQRLQDAPMRRAEHSAAWDTANNRMIVSAGWNGRANRSEFYEYKSGTWTKLDADPGVSVLPTGQVSDLDNARDLQLYNDGEFHSFPYSGPVGDILLDSGPPAPRYLFPHVWDSTNKRLIIHGGYDNASPAANDSVGAYADTWAYSTQTSSEVIATDEQIRIEEDAP